jgi:N4-gp56 family major capsid protein
MAQFTWVADATTGVFKNHQLSSQIRMAAIKEAKFMQFVKPEDGYGKKKGESITIVRVSNISVPTTDVLSEVARIPEDTMAMSTQAITAVERGRALPYTKLSVDFASFDLQNAIQSKLKDQLKLSMDKAAGAKFVAGQILAIPTGIAATTFETDGSASNAAVSNLNMYHVESVRDYMYGTLNIAPYSGDDYVCILVTLAKRGLLRDPSWVDWKKYTDPAAKYNGEIGRIENIRFVETNNSQSSSGLRSGVGTGSVLGEAVFFGADPVVMAVAEDPHLLAEENVGNDFGRSKSIAWYGIYEFGQIWSDSANAGEARVVYMTST